jgi:hypothetical protein
LQPGWVSVLFEDTYFVSLIHAPGYIHSDSVSRGRTLSGS